MAVMADSSHSLTTLCMPNVTSTMLRCTRRETIFTRFINLINRHVSIII